VGTAAKSLEVRLLGGVELRRGGAPIALPPSKKTRALLAYLAATARDHTREHLCAMFWDGPDDPRAALRWSLSKLRALVDDDGATRLGAGGDRIGFAAEGAWIDWAFVRGVDASSAPDELERAAELIGRELCDGVDLPECTGFVAWLAAEREALRRERRRLFAAVVERSAGDAAIGWALRWIAAEPLDEAATIAAMRALAAAGRIDDALAQYHRFTDALARDGGVRPSHELERARMGLAPPVPVPLPLPVPEPPRPTLLGRDPELAAIHAWWLSTTPMLAFTGEPGIGKSSLLAAAADRARQGGARVLAARPFELEHVRPFGVWRDLLASLDPSEIPAPLHDELSALAPALGHAPADRVDAARLDAAVIALARHLAAAAPLVIVVDDLQWCDERSAAALLAAIRDVPRLRVVAAARPGELADNSAASRAYHVLARQKLVTELALSPLAPDACAALVAQVAPSADARAIADAAGGNPLYALEAARAGGDAGASFDAIVAERTGRLGASARELFPWCAAAGRRFRPAWIGRAAELPASVLAQALAELEAHGLVRAVDNDDYALAHDLVRDAAYRSMSAPRRRLAHARLAHALDELAGDPAAVAHHAALAGEHALAARACTDAAAACMRIAAFADAEQLIAAGLAHAEHLPDASRVARSIELRHIEAFSMERGDPACIAALEALIAEARALGLEDPVTSAGHALGRLRLVRGDLDGAAAATHMGVESTRGSASDAELFALANSAMCSVVVQRELPRSRSLVEAAAEMARARRTQVCDLELARGLLARLDAEPAAGPLLDRAATRARADRDNWRAHLALVARIGVALDDGAYDDALAIAQRAQPIADKLPGGSEPSHVRALAAVARYGLDPSDDNVRAVDVAIAELHALDAQRALGGVQAAAAEIDLANGRVASARTRADDAWHAALTIDLPVDAAVAAALRARAAADPALAKAAIAEGERACPDPPPRAAAAFARARDSTPAPTPAPTRPG